MSEVELAIGLANVLNVAEMTMSCKGLGRVLAQALRESPGVVQCLRAFL